MIKSSVVLFFVVLCLFGCASQPQGVAVTPGKIFAGGYINIRAPQTEGWQLIYSSGSGMAFAKRSDAQASSFAASVNMFALAPTTSPEGFGTLIKEAAAKDTDPSRFDVQQQSLKYSAERNYSCVRYQSDAKDRSPKSSANPLILEIYGLYCRHPIRQDTGFAAVYSYRGASRYPTLRREAETFIQGVQVPGK